MRVWEETDASAKASHQTIQKSKEPKFSMGIGR